MPPKKGIAFGRIGSFGQLTLKDNKDQDDGGSGGFGKFGAAALKKKEEDSNFTEEPTDAVKEMMGFQGFGKTVAKVAKGFDIESLVEQSKQVAKEREMAKKAAELEASLANPKDSSGEEDDGDLVGPLPPPPPPVAVEPEAFKAPKKPAKPRDEDADSDDDSEEDEDDEEHPEKRIPAAMEITLAHGTKTVSALNVDHSGARLVTGSVDYDVKLWDFAGMSSTLQSFRTIKPVEWYICLFYFYFYYILNNLFEFFILQSPNFGSTLFHHW